MLVIFLLIFVSLTLALAFLAAFIWAVKSGQFEDTCTSLHEDVNGRRIAQIKSPKETLTNPII